MTDTQWTLTTYDDAYIGSDHTTPHDAPVVVLGHSLGSSHIMWDSMIPSLTERFRVIRYDLPGHGGSEPAPINQPLTMGALLDALERTLDSLGIERFHLGGLSIGGLITIAGAQRWGVGDQPRIISATPMASGAKNGTYDMWIERAALVREQGTGVLVDATMERWFSPEFHTEHPDSVQRIREAFLACSSEGYAQCCEILSTTDLTPQLDTISVPVTIINGSDDAGFDNSAAQSLAKALVACAPVTTMHIENTRHMCAMERPDWVATCLRAKADND